MSLRETLGDAYDLAVTQPVVEEPDDHRHWWPVMCAKCGCWRDRWDYEQHASYCDGQKCFGHACDKVFRMRAQHRAYIPPCPYVEKTEQDHTQEAQQ